VPLCHLLMPFRQTLSKLSFGLAFLQCTTLRAIMTSYQQFDSPIFVNTRFWIGKGNFPNEGLTWSLIVKMQIAVPGL
jgi:hypothetical protein